MFTRNITKIQDIVDWNLCIGCGACYDACDKDAVQLVNIENQGIRPRFDTTRCAECTECLSFCPGYQVDAKLIQENRDVMEYNYQQSDEIGPCLEIWEGHASDAEIQYNASSGGILTALSLYCLEKENMEFVLHAGADSEQPWLNKTYRSRTKEELLERTGSRYAPASPCDDLSAIAKSENPCVFIGKPCDSAAVMQARQSRPELHNNLGLVLTFFCAGTPSTQGTKTLLDSFGVEKDKVTNLRYRGKGWPGKFRVTTTQDKQPHELSYEESWGRLTKHKPFRCQICPDGIGRMADITAGDAWHAKPEASEDERGRSIILVRTPRGKAILRKAIKNNYITAKPLQLEKVHDAQENLLWKKRQVFGRLLGMRLMFVPVTQFPGFSLKTMWKKNSWKTQAKSILGTLRRVWQRGLWHRQTLFDPQNPENELKKE